jgi:hypothetical protein
MAAGRAYEKVFTALEEFERESNFAERRKVSEIKGELLLLTRTVLKKYTQRDEEKTKYFLAQPSRMLEREMKHWNTVALRRMRQVPNGRNPWKISFARNMPFEVFGVVKVKCNLANGTVSGTSRICKIVFTNGEHVASLLHHGKIKPKADSPHAMHKIYKNKDYGMLNCRQDRPFTITYSFTKELISISLFYGVFNEFGIPKHICIGLNYYQQLFLKIFIIMIFYILQ